MNYAVRPEHKKDRKKPGGVSNAKLRRIRESCVGKIMTNRNGRSARVLDTNRHTTQDNMRCPRERTARQGGGGRRRKRWGSNTLTHIIIIIFLAAESSCDVAARSRSDQCDDAQFVAGLFGSSEL